MRFAVLRLTDLKVSRFKTKEELQDAIRAYRKRSIGYCVYRYHAAEGIWTEMDARE